MKKENIHTIDEIKERVNPMYAGAGADALSGMAKGALAGAMVPPPGIGTLIGSVGGAIIGGASALIGGSKKAKADKQVEDLAVATEINTNLENTTSSGGERKDMYGNRVTLHNNTNITAEGGSINSNGMDLQEFNEGGTHEQNPQGGIMVGIGDNGKPNTVEEGETKLGGVVFSNRIPYSKIPNMPPFIKGESCADASKAIAKRFEERHDPYSRQTEKVLYERLFAYQEAIKQEANLDMNQEPNQEMKAGGQIENNQVNPLNQNQLIYGNESRKNTPSSVTPPTGFNFNWDEQSAEDDAFFNDELYAKTQGDIQDSVTTLRNNNNTSPELNLPGNDKVQSPAPTPPQDSWFSSSENMGKLTAGIGIAAQGAGIISNIIASNRLKKPKKLTPFTINKTGIKENLVNRQAIMRELTNREESARGALAENSSGDWGAYASNAAGMHAGTAKASSMAMLESDIADAQEKARVQGAGLEIDKFNSIARGETAQANEQNYAAYETQKGLYDQGIAANIGSLGQTMVNYGIAKQTGKYVGL